MDLVAWSRGMENETQYEREGNEHKVNSQGTQHIKEQREKVSKIRREGKAKKEWSIKTGSIQGLDPCIDR